MTRGRAGEFVGCTRIAEQQAETLRMFRAAEHDRDWARIHRAHYDWWMFPIDQPSSWGFAYTVTQADIDEMLGIPGFLRDYRVGVRILLLAWGWNVADMGPVRDPDPEQCWQGWPIRLEKCGRSLWLLGQRDLYDSVRAFAMNLIGDGVPLSYRGRDCGDFFREHGR